MEDIHRPDSRPWILMGSVRVGDLIETWAQNDVSNELKLNKNNLKEFVKNELKIDDQMVDLLEDDCNTSNLDCEEEDEELFVVYEKSFEIPENVKLETLRLQKQHIERYATDRCYRTSCLQSLRYRNKLIKVENDSNYHSIAIKEDSIRSDNPLAILTVQLYRPIRFSSPFANSHRYSFVCDQELQVLSSQYLTELRNAFTCVADISNPNDCSDNPRNALNITSADVYKSAFFFINNTFFNDMRDDSNIDYSKPIIKWSEETERGIGPFKSVKMEETRFVELELQLGYPYLYQHQGDCEHILVFSDIRLLKPNVESSDPKDYPKIISTNRRTQVRCGICNLNTAKWITYGDKRLPQNPFFFCENCFYAFNYDNNEQKIANFKAYPFLDKSALL